MPWLVVRTVGTMGGIMSAVAVAFGDEPISKRGMVQALLRGSIIGGATLCCINLLRCLSLPGCITLNRA